MSHELNRRAFVVAGSASVAGAAAVGRQESSGEPTSYRQDDGPLHFVEARELSRRIRAREVTVVEVMQAYLAQIDRVNPRVNAIPTLRDRDELFAEARAADKALANNVTPGPLHGFPLAVKDLARTKGIRTTRGSRIFQDFVPDIDEIHVERLKAAGGIIIGKTNVPEFGAGSQTFNEVFGPTLNPYDTTKTCGGSSGGAAVALATGMVPLADGSDLGGSLRNPASFCNVVGFRPSPGRVPRLTAHVWNTMPVSGPIGRTVGDVAFLLSVMAGPDPRDPISLDDPGGTFLRGLDRDFRGTRIAWSQDLGRYPVDPAVNAVINASQHFFDDLGCIVEAGEPDFEDADEIFQVLRAWGYAERYRDELRDHRDLMKDTVIWNIEKGLNLTARQIADAEAKRTELYHRVMGFLEDYDFLVLPVSQVPPFSVDVEWVREINGVPMETYIDWMATCYAITCTGLPAVSVPAGFTADGLPIGLQIVGRHHRDFEVLQLAYAFERVSRFGERRPAVA